VHRYLLALALTLWTTSAIAACSPAASPTPSSTPTGRPVQPGPEGIPEDCPFRVGDLCYDDAESACAAAGCAAASCTVLESYPAQVRCP
jgi:hypothetical protein